MMPKKMIEIPDSFFEIDGVRPEDWPDHPEVRAAVEWFRGRIGDGEWRRRRMAAAHRLYDLVVNGVQPGKSGRYFDERDTFAWYLFQAEAYVDHIWNYDPVFGARVVPVFAAIGRYLNLLSAVEGVDERVARMVGAERAQPNGPIFELLVAAAYARQGGAVSFVPEQPGATRSHDFDVTLNGRVLAVECKRMEVGDFGEREHLRVRELWGPTAAYLGSIDCSTLAQVDFLVPVATVPADYLTNKVKDWRLDPRRPLSWEDRVGRGRIAALDLRPLQMVLECGSASKAGPRPFLPQVIETKQLSQINWGFRPTPISTTLAAFDTVFEYLSMTRLGPALDADPHIAVGFVRAIRYVRRIARRADQPRERLDARRARQGGQKRRAVSVDSGACRTCGDGYGRHQAECVSVHVTLLKSLALMP